VLLVYAPELYRSASSPYLSRSSGRTLLRITLCAEDTDSERALLGALSSYIKSSPSLHLRIVRTDRAHLFSQPDPQADVFIFPADLPADTVHFLRGQDANPDTDPLFLFQGAQGDPFSCGIHPSSKSADAAFALLSALCGASP